MNSAKTMHCECGNETYLIKFEADGQAWAECKECGRPTKAFGDGLQKQAEWDSRN